MQIYLVGTACRADKDDYYCDLICARVAGLVSGEIPAVICSSGELYLMDEITDAVILDNQGIVLRQGLEEWYKCLENPASFGLKSCSIRKLKQDYNLLIKK